jgi:hypothetical protein
MWWAWCNISRAREGEVSGKVVVESSGKIVTKLTISSGENVLYSTIPDKIYYTEEN